MYSFIFDYLNCTDHDHIHSIFDGKMKGVPIVSIVANLNEDYEGAEFVDDVHGRKLNKEIVIEARMKEMDREEGREIGRGGGRVKDRLNREIPRY